jgi:hypothetical protein
LDYDFYYVIGFLDIVGFLDIIGFLILLDSGYYLDFLLIGFIGLDLDLETNLSISSYWRIRFVLDIGFEILEFRKDVFGHLTLVGGHLISAPALDPTERVCILGYSG